MDLGLEGKAFLITGGTDGLGLALAKTLITEGARVAICGRDDSRLVNAQQELGEKALCVRADVTDAVQLDDFIDTVIDTFGRLDGAVNNAGRSSGSARPARTPSRRAARASRRGSGSRPRRSPGPPP